eukprot:gene37368-44821_t
MIGFTFQCGAVLAESARLVLTNLLMKQLKLDPLSTLYYVAPLCFVFVSFFLAVLLINGLVAFTLNIAVVMLIGNTSALVLTLAGIFKDLMLVCLSMVVFSSPVTQLQFLGYAVALLGLNLHKEFKKAPERFNALAEAAA